MEKSKLFWEKVYTENAPKLIGVCRRYVSDSQLAEDLMHDAFLLAISKYSTYKGKGSFEGWLRKIAVNTALMHLRTQKTKNIDAEILSAELIHTDMHDEHSTKTIRQAIEEADFSDKELIEQLDLLPYYHKLVFNLHVIDGHKHTDIAKQLDISIGTSKSHLSRARKKIQDLLYQKTIQQAPERKDKKKKNSLLLLLAFTCKDSYVDSIFRNQLSSYAIPLTSSFSNIFTAVEWVSIKVPTLLSFVFKWFTYIFVAGIGAFVFIFGIMNGAITYTANDADELPLQTNIHSTPGIYSATHKDTCAIAKEVDSINGVEKNKPEPVIVRKQIIEVRTVEVIDTVIITKDTINEE